MAELLVPHVYADGVPHQAVQVAWLVSGGLAGVALVGSGLGLLLVHLRRRDAARERATIREATRQVADLAEAVARGHAGWPSPGRSDRDPTLETAAGQLP